MKNRNRKGERRNDYRWSLYQASRCIFKRINEKIKKQNTVACRYNSVVIARVRRRVSCPTIGRLCEPMRERESKVERSGKKIKRERERELSTIYEGRESTACFACTSAWCYVVSVRDAKRVNCKSCVQPSAYIHTYICVSLASLEYF